MHFSREVHIANRLCASLSQVLQVSFPYRFSCIHSLMQMCRKMAWRHRLQLLVLRLRIDPGPFNRLMFWLFTEMSIGVAARTAHYKTKA